MIRVKLIDGSYAGRVREIPEYFEPLEFLNEISRHGWHWEVDYSQTTSKESFVWGRADMVVRAVRALAEGRRVYFLGKIYLGLEAVGELEDAVVDSGRMIRLGFDDKRGVQILAPEQEN